MDAKRRAELRNQCSGARLDAFNDCRCIEDAENAQLAIPVSELLALLDADERVEQALLHCRNVREMNSITTTTNTQQALCLDRENALCADIDIILRGSHE